MRDNQVRDRSVHEDEWEEIAADANPSVVKTRWNVKTIGHDLDGQLPYTDLPMLVGLMVILIGLSMVGTYLGTGLIWIGAGLAVGGYGGYVTLHHPIMAISGTGGIVLIVLGALIDKL
jgi:hypothetical protein